MNIPIPLLGSWLEDRTIEKNEKLKTVLSIMDNVDAFPYHSAGKGCCWLAYRHLEEDLFCPLIHDYIENSIKRVQKEDSPLDQSARWINSLLMVKAFIEIKESKLIYAEGTLLRINNNAVDRISKNPTGAVNVCRAISLLVAMNYGKTNGGAWINVCIELFKHAVSKWEMINVAPCAGNELVAAARATAICIQLSPSVLAKYKGTIMNLGDILDMEPHGHYRDALKKIIYQK